jgi:3-oxoacyl-[acyl-carrier protein] reductase
MGKLDGKIALVTGGARGIGQAICLAFAAEGADVAVNDVRMDEALQATVAAIEELGRRAWALPADVADEQAVQTMADRLLAQAGRVDVLVNNAGIANMGPLVEMSTETWDRMIAVHLRGTFLCTRAILPQMLERGSGKIINLGSQLGQIGREGWTHYAAAKGGIIAFTKALAREVAPSGIHVNCIAPGPISTGLVKTDPEVAERMKAALPLRRFGTVDEVAPTAVFLASADSDYYVGQTLGPNGGDVML